MAYYFDGVKCDTLAELNALRQSRGAQSVVAAHSSKRGTAPAEDQRVYGHASTCDCNRCEDLATKHAHSSFAG